MSDGGVVITFVSGEREFPIPDHVDIFHLRKEIDACDKTALEAVMDVDAERIFLEKKAEELSALGFYLALIVFDCKNCPHDLILFSYVKKTLLSMYFPTLFLYFTQVMHT